MIRRLIQVGLAMTLATGTVVVTPGLAGAARPAEREHYTFGPDVFPGEEICGITATVTATGRGVFMARTVPGSGGTAFLGFDNLHVTEVWSTSAGSVTIERRSTFRETSATDVGPVTYDPDGDGPLPTVTSDDVWLFTFQEAGRFRLYDADGDLLLKANGVFRGQEQFDTLGDQVPGGRFVPGTFEPLKEAGRSFTEEQLCEAVLAELT